jgi:hypothetical protein
MFKKDELEELLSLVGNNLEKQITIYMIGGCALSFKNLKPSTKDIDIIVKSKQDFDILEKTMNRIGFKSESEKESDFYATALAVYKKGESRIDVFLKQVGKMLFLSEGMIKRSEHYKKYGNLVVNLISNEDIFLFKSMTAREGDVYDCDRLIKEGLGYGIIYEEILEQIKSGKNWFFWLFESLCRLENHNNIKIPIKNKVLGLVKNNWEERPPDFMEDVENSREHLNL